jgi:hypothetical protein
LAVVLKSHHRHTERCLGASVADRISKLLDASNRFVARVRDTSMTPKGEALLAVARGELIHTHAFVTDFSSDRDRLSQFLGANGESGYLCLTVQALRGVRRPSRIVAFGLVRRDAFARFVDPWPAAEVTFAGYEFETEKYEARLRQRQRMRYRLGLDEAPRSRVTGLSASEFGTGKIDAANMTVSVNDSSAEADDAALSIFDRAVGNRGSTHRRPTVYRKPGELIVPARYMTFCGKSWAAFTDMMRGGG